jgi:hypothetical protein
MTRSDLALVLLVVLATIAPCALGQSWSSRLQDGSRIEVDPRTNRAMVYSPSGVVTPLWDGVHRLEDGSSITVRSGIMVPNREVLELRQGVPAGPGPAFVAGHSSPCVILVRKVCGLHEECAGHPACSYAKQLRGIELDEQREGPASSSGGVLETPTQCADALKDEEFFVPCGLRRRDRSPTACQRLVDRVCGMGNQCANNSGCRLARQLMEMEYQDRLKSVNPEAITDSGRQCQQSAADKDLFAPCER